MAEKHGGRAVGSDAEAFADSTRELSRWAAAENLTGVVAVEHHYMNGRLTEVRAFPPMRWVVERKGKK